MSADKKPFRFIAIVTTTYEFEVWARDSQEALDLGSEIWMSAPTVGGWETGEDTEYMIGDAIRPFSTADTTKGGNQ